MNIEKVKKMEEKRDIKGLVKALTYSSEFASVENKERICSEAAKALVRINDTQTVELLIKVIASAWWDESVRIKVAKVLGELKDLRAVEPLINALGVKDDVKLGLNRASLRRAAAEALGELQDLRAVEPLIRALADSHEIVRGAAAGALGKLGDPRAVEPLIKTLSDVIGWVRKTAAEALAVLGEPGWKEIITGSDDDFMKLGKSENLYAIKGLVSNLYKSYQVPWQTRKSIAIAILTYLKSHPDSNIIDNNVLAYIERKHENYSNNVVLNGTLIRQNFIDTGIGINVREFMKDN